MKTLPQLTVAALAAALAARFKVNPDGTTTDIAIVDSKLQNSTFGTCLGSKIKGWTFSKAKQKSDNYDLLTAF